MTNLIDDIKRDQLAGTPGPWLQSHRKNQDDMYRTQVYPANDTDNTIATIHWHSVKIDGGLKTDRAELSRRIARVPAMEEALLAAVEVARTLEVTLHILANESNISTVSSADDALTAFRKALGAGQ